jgi:hypothetical protein
MVLGHLSHGLRKRRHFYSSLIKTPRRFLDHCRHYAPQDQETDGPLEQYPSRKHDQVDDTFARDKTAGKSARYAEE